MDILCDFNIPTSLVNELKADSHFSVEEVTQSLSKPWTDSKKSQYAADNDLILLTDNHKFLQTSPSHGVILYSVPNLNDQRAVRELKNINMNGATSDLRSIP